jgi:hypothetical protein
MKMLLKIAGGLTMLAGLWPLISVIKRGNNPLKIDYLDYLYFNYHVIAALLVFLGSLGLGMVLFWFGRRQKN